MPSLRIYRQPCRAQTSSWYALLVLHNTFIDWREWYKMSLHPAVGVLFLSQYTSYISVEHIQFFRILV